MVVPKSFCIFVVAKGERYPPEQLKQRILTKQTNTTMTTSKTYPTTNYYYVRYSQADGDGTIVATSQDYEKELMKLASRISEASPSIDVDLVENLSDVRDIVEDILSYNWTVEDIDRIMSEYDEEDDNDPSILLNYVECVLENTSCEWMENLCWEVYDSTDIALEFDSIEKLYEHWLDTKMPA